MLNLLALLFIFIAVSCSSVNALECQYLLGHKFSVAQGDLEDFNFYDSKEEEEKPYDPLERVNRQIFKVNEKLIKELNKTNLIKTKPKKYKITPVVILDNILKNCLEVNNSVNHFLQGHPDKALKALWRFYINSTLGALGGTDIASTLGLPYEVAKLDDTLIKYKIPSGPFLFIPLLGPYTTRQFIAESIELSFHPAFLFTGNALITSLIYIISPLVHLNENVGYYNLLITSGGLDTYAKMRNIYFQSKSTIANNFLLN